MKQRHMWFVSVTMFCVFFVMSATYAQPPYSLPVCVAEGVQHLPYAVSDHAVQGRTVSLKREIQRHIRWLNISQVPCRAGSLPVYEIPSTGKLPALL